MLRHFPLYSTDSNITRKLLSNNNKATVVAPPAPSLPVLSTTGSINTSSGTINDAFDGNLSTGVLRSQQISVNNHTGSMIFTWDVAVPVSSTIRLAVAMASSGNQTTSVSITDSSGNVHNTSVSNQWNGGAIPLTNLNSAYPYSNIKKIEFFNSYNPATVAAVEVNGTVLVY